MADNSSIKQIDLEHSVQINDGFSQTSGDGVNMAFDTQYGIMFCVYMPGFQGYYGESRSKISLSYFPASQPTNIKFVDISSGNGEYAPNIISLGGGKVRLIYETNTYEDCDHLICYRDFDYLTETLTEESIIMLRQDDGTETYLTQSAQFAYLEKQGYHDHTYIATEQIIIGGSGIFRGEDGYLYGAISSFLSEVILYRSKDNMASVEFFAIYPKPAQYEFDYRFLDGKIYAIYRTDRDEDAISFTTSCDMGKTWTEPIELENSIQCRPRVVVHNHHIVLAYNYYNADTGNRPAIQQGRTSVRMRFGELENPHENPVVVDLYSKYGIVNMCLIDIMGDLYMAYSASVLALEYHNGNPLVRGKDAVRYIKLGDLTPQEAQII